MLTIDDRYVINDRTRCPQRAAYTVVELMVTIVIVSVLAATLGMFFIQLLNIQERDREEAYIQERLSDVCGAYADALSVGSGFIIGTDKNAQSMIVKYRQETGGVSLETGIVTHVSYLASFANALSGTLDSNIYGVETNNLVSRLSCKAHGVAPLLPILGDVVSCTITPLGTVLPTYYGLNGYDAEYCAKMTANYNFKTTDAALGWLEITARYQVRDKFGRSAKNAFGEPVWTNTTVGRVVRLWNRE